MGHSLDKNQTTIYWQDHVYITVAPTVSMTQMHPLENFQPLSFITPFSSTLFYLVGIAGLFQQIDVTLKLAHQNN